VNVTPPANFLYFDNTLIPIASRAQHVIGERGAHGPSAPVYPALSIRGRAFYWDGGWFMFANTPFNQGCSERSSDPRSHRHHWGPFQQLILGANAAHDCTRTMP